MNNGRKIFILILVIFLLSIISIVIYLKYPIKQTSQNTATITSQKVTEGSENKEDHNSEFIIPSSVSLKVPFTPQAPTANWDELHNEACEEASSLMVAQYFAPSSEALAKEDSTKLKPEFVEQEIDKLTKWQQDNFGYNLDTTVSETAEMIEKVYGLKAELKENFSENDIKEALSKNYLVVISFNGRLLGNPNYKLPGPIHHMLVIKGYNKTGIITNDPGTKRGLNYNYTFQTLYSAAADWDHSQNNVDTSKKMALIIKLK